MWQPLQLAEGRRVRTKRVYEYRMRDEHTAEIRITSEADEVCTLVDADVLDRIKQEITHLYIYRNASNQPHIAVQVKRKGRRMLARWILGVEEIELEVDHINGDTLNNRRENLRVVTISENRRNRKTRRTKKWGLRGVSYQNGKWVSRIHLGTFRTKEEAHQAYMEAYDKLFPGVLVQERFDHPLQNAPETKNDTILKRTKSMTRTNPLPPEKMSRLTV